jgi:hypothetical protein
MTSTAIQITPIPPAHLAQVRTSGLDVSRNPVVTLEEMPDEPLRCCLRNSRPGERLILFGYAPPGPVASPYREVGAVLAHADQCDAPPTWDTYPTHWIGRPQVLRAYDSRGWIHPATTMHDGSDPLTALRSVLAHPGVVEVHSRNVTYGCFMFIATAGR